MPKINWSRPEPWLIAIGLLTLAAVAAGIAKIQLPTWVLVIGVTLWVTRLVGAWATLFSSWPRMR